MSRTRRRFVQTAAVLAGSIPVAGALYVFAFEHRHCQVRLVDLPVAGLPTSQALVVYVNHGLGTIGVPLRLGVPPEISLLTLRCA